MDPWESVQDRDLGRLSPGPSLLRVTAGGKALGSGDRRLCPRADSQRAAKNSAAGSRYVVSCSRERRGQSGRVSWEGDAPTHCPRVLLSFCPHPEVLGASQEQNPKGSRCRSRHCAGSRQGRGRGGKLGCRQDTAHSALSAWQPPKLPVTQSSSSSTQTQEHHFPSPEQLAEGAHSHIW